MARLGRVGITDVAQVVHSRHKLPNFRRQRRLEYGTVAAALGCLLEQRLEPAVAGQLVRAAPQLLACDGRAAMLFGGLGRFGVDPDALARGIVSFPEFANLENWADYQPTAKMLDELVRDEGGLAAPVESAACKLPASTLPAARGRSTASGLPMRPDAGADSAGA